MRLYQKILHFFFPSLAPNPQPPAPKKAVRIPIGKASDFPEGQGTPVVAAGRRLAVFRLGEELFALHNACPHNLVPLSSGIVNDRILVCRAHGARFDLKTGQVLRGPARKPVRTYPVYDTGETIEVEID